MDYKLQVFTNQDGVKCRNHTNNQGVTWFCAKLLPLSTTSLMVA